MYGLLVQTPSKVQPNGIGSRARTRVFQFRPARVHTRRAHDDHYRYYARSRSAAPLPPLLRYHILTDTHERTFG